MNRNNEFFLELLSAGAVGEGVKASDFSVDWKGMQEMAIHHHVLPFVYTAVTLSQDKWKMDPDRLREMRLLTYGASLRQFNAIEALKALYGKIKENGISVIVFKGIVLAELYSDPLLRTSSDTDMLVRKEDYEKVRQILLSSGYSLHKETAQDNVQCFISPALTIDLHTRLWGDTYGRHVDIAQEMNIETFHKCVTVTACGLEIQTLGYQEHFIYIMLHMAKHFVAKGAGIRHLLDLTLYFNRFRNGMDMEKIWKAIDSFGFCTLFEYIFTICIQFFHMEKGIFYNGLPDINPALYNTLLDDILEGGTFGTIPERSVSYTVVKQSYYGNRRQKSRLCLAFYILFPPASVLPSKYMYVKKCKLLLPIAWLHRLFNFLLHRFFVGKRGFLYESVSNAGRRIKLLTEMKLIK